MSETLDLESGWWRMLDANFNRCGEGLRVVEDWCRFVANDSMLARLAKEIRHQLHEASLDWSLPARLLARDVPADVGKTIKTTTESKRPDDLSLLQANCYRVQQSLRVMEETAKRLQLTAAPLLEQLRYRSYELQQHLILKLATTPDSSEYSTSRQPIAAALEAKTGKTLAKRLELLDQATLYVLTDSCADRATYQAHIQQLVNCGVDVIQLRDKTMSDRDLWEYSWWTAQQLTSSNVLFIVNDRPDIAAACGADGVHVGQSELPVDVVRQIVGPQVLVGLSTHDLTQVTTAQQSSANYLGLGPVFPSTTKAFAEFPGLETLRQCVPVLERPTFAIGGIYADNVERVYATGITRIAVQSALAPGRITISTVRQLQPKTTA